MKASAEQFSLNGDKFLGTPYSTMDCQAFVEATMKTVGINDDLPGSNAWFRKMTWVGTPYECKRKFGSIPVGAILFIWANDGKDPEKYKPDGKGNVSHMGIYIARQDGAIHSSYSRGCVCYSKFVGKAISGGWNRIGLWDRFTYGDKIDALLSGQETPKSDNSDNDIKVVIHMTQAIVQTENGAGVNFRSKKSTVNGFLGKIPEGAEVSVLENDGTWSSITYNGKSGYVMSRFLVAVAGDTPAGEIAIPMDRSTAEALYNALGTALYGGVG